ncbi:hypothetical protein BD408DRAFT_408839 [Parasitella parasitica]|nr:hypothetical protein BD408DRAFT_408839 [Parasitella parasitica]
MPSPILVVAIYALLIVSIPFVLNYSNLGDFIPLLSYHLGIDYYLHKVEPIVLCLGLVTFYTYVVLGFIFDIIQACRRNHEQGVSQNALLYGRFERAHRQLRKVFPPYVVSCLLMYANTTRFDTLRNSFMVLQTVLLLAQPIASMYHRPYAGLICKFFYRAVLFWSILYAVFPRESQHYISHLTHLICEYMGLHGNHSTRHYYYGNYPTNNKYYGNPNTAPSNYQQQWIL